MWEFFIDDVFSLWNGTKDEVNDFINKANTFHSTIKFTVEILEKEITFLDTNMYKGQRLYRGSIFDVRTHYKPTETFQLCTNFILVTHQASKKAL